MCVVFLNFIVFFGVMVTDYSFFYSYIKIDKASVSKKPLYILRSYIVCTENLKMKFRK